MSETKCQVAPTVESAAVDLEHVAAFSSEVRDRAVEVVGLIVGLVPPGESREAEVATAGTCLERIESSRRYARENLQTILDEINRL